jgi:hypothetical protein
LEKCSMAMRQSSAVCGETIKYLSMILVLKMKKLGGRYFPKAAR